MLVCASGSSHAPSLERRTLFPNLKLKKNIFFLNNLAEKAWFKGGYDIKPLTTQLVAHVFEIVGFCESYFCKELSAGETCFHSPDPRKDGLLSHSENWQRVCFRVGACV